uniref:Malate dehydrogenase 1 n=1 Tax=Triatoma infestans TaxID=30076 RepID=A0A170ZKU1_TRIIF
MDYCSGIEN